METTGKSPDSESTYILKDKSPSQDSGHTSHMTDDSRHLVEPESDKKKIQSNIPFTSFNFINSIVGSGIIGIPYAINQAGFGLGILLLVLVAVVTDCSVLMLIEAGYITGLTSYQDVVRTAMGKPVFYILTLLQFTYPFIAMVSYNVIIGDTITRLFVRIGGESLSNTVLGNRQFVILLVTLVITLPISLYKNIARLSKWAFLSIFLVLVILVMVLIRIPDFAQTIPTTADSFTFARPNVTQAIGIMAFAFMCHHNVFLIHASLENNTSKRWKIVTHSSFIVSLVIMMVIGVAGYVTFKTYTQGDLLESYCHRDDLANTGRFLFAVTIMLTYPIECFVTREVVELSLFASRQPSPTLRHIAVTVTIAILAAALSITTDCLGIVLEFNGVLVASPLAFVIPSILVIKLRGEPYFSWRNVVPTLVFLFGVFVSVVGTVMAIMNVVQSNTCNHGAEPVYCYPEVGRNHTVPYFSYSV
ncbi:putative sodium-coupled neutral amino acid transporter 11 [Liolophura sinensis]|uniref:putative sodium-coupled neutral amino acid transporter 11 n=1 Tax=Liolophura sinensis TaxID=3198878 RepID=UPI003158ED16